MRHIHTIAAISVYVRNPKRVWPWQVWLPEFVEAGGIMATASVEAVEHDGKIVDLVSIKITLVTAEGTPL